MAVVARVVRQLPVGLYAHHDRYLKARAERYQQSEAEIVRAALDDLMAAHGHMCVLGDSETECLACGGTGGQV